jgi:hypothetical protein
MSIFVLYAGPFGEQIINAISTGGLAGEIVGVYELRPEQVIDAHGGNPSVLRELWENPDRFVPTDIPQVRAGMLLVVGIHGKLSDLVVPVARRLGAKLVIYGIDDRDSEPEARKSISDDLSAAGCRVLFPEPLCSLEPSGEELPDPFLSRFGRPRFRARIDRDGRIAELEVFRDTPCGSASSVRAQLAGLSIADRPALARRCYEAHNNEAADHYCLAEMDPAHPLMQEAGDLLKDAIFEACGIPTTRDEMEAQIAGSGGIGKEALRALIVTTNPGALPGGRVGCTTARSFDRYLKELICSGRVRESDGGILCTAR